MNLTTILFLIAHFSISVGFLWVNPKHIIETTFVVPSRTEDVEESREQFLEGGKLASEVISPDFMVEEV